MENSKLQEEVKKPYILSNQSGLSQKEYEKVLSKFLPRKLSLFPLKVTERVATSLPYTEEICATGNYDTTRVYPINGIILHTTVCAAQGAINRFATKNAGAAAHYMVGLDGKIYHFLEEYYTAYQAGNYAVNQQTIGVEHEDGGNYNSPRPDILYTKSAQLVADICKFYNFPCNRSVIRLHKEVSQLGTACPDSLDADRIVSQASALLQPPEPDFVNASKESAKYVYGFNTQGTVTQRMAATIAIFHKYNIPNPN